MLRLKISDTARRQREKNFFSAICECDISDLLAFLDDVSQYLVGPEPSVLGFKGLVQESSVGFRIAERLLSPINTAIYPYLTVREPELRAHFLSIALQFLRFPLKLSFVSIGLEEKALADYLEVEGELETMSPVPDELCDSLSSIIYSWFKDFRIDSLKPSHGPGSVAEGPLTQAEKFRVLGCDKAMQIVLRNHSFPNSYTEFYPYQPDTDIERISRTIFVPKTARKLRTISMEPASLQYVQQGVMKELYQFIEKHPYLGVRVKLRDQGQNQILALEGSLLQTFATVDLSHASDSVSWDLVRRVFKSVPLLYKWLLVTRSSKTLLPDGNIVALKKYAPMGSALCFPVECILFAAMVEHVLGMRRTRYKEYHTLYSVYGGDIVLPTSAFDDLVEVLGLCGFSTNARKSHCVGPYRESCGKEYYAGIDISVLYYRTPFYNNRVSPSAYGSWCSGANNALLHRLPVYRDYLITKILSVSRKLGPYFGYSPNLSPQLYSPQPTNFHVKSRWNRGYQRWEGKFTSVKSKPRDGEPDDETLRYFIKLVEMAWRPLYEGPSHQDESPSSITLQGCVEYFSSTTAPIVPFVKPSRLDAWDWDGT